MTDQVLERFWDKVKVDPITGCWNWIGSKRNFYGTFRNKTTVSAHRFAYEVNKGKIPIELELDHLCRNPSCVNPEHLEAVTPKVNTLRSNATSAINARKTYCKNGHLLKDDNVNFYKYMRQCRICNKLKSHLYFIKNREKHKRYCRNYNALIKNIKSIIFQDLMV